MGLLPQQLLPRFDSSFEQLAFLFYPICLVPVFVLLYTERKHQKQLRTTPRGCRKLGLQGPSSLSDEQVAKYSRPSSTGTAVEGDDEPWRIKALFIHPIKSCAPIELDTAHLSTTGLTWDRQFCFAEYIVPSMFPLGTPEHEKKQPRWTFRTLRKPGYEKLIHVRPEVWVPDADYVRINRIGDPNLDGVLVINYPNIPQGHFLNRLFSRAAQYLRLLPKESSFRVPLLPPKDHTYPLETFSIWIDTPQALNYGRHIPADFKAYLRIPESTPFSLFRASPSHYRPIHYNVPLSDQDEGNLLPYQPYTAFADSQPLHLQNLASVRDVAARVQAEIPHFSARRFRPNIVVVGPRAYDEDDWKTIRVLHHPTQAANKGNGSPEPEQSLVFHTACHTMRCRLPNVDPDTGVRHPSEPDRTLRAFRRIDRGDEKNAALGLQIVPARDVDADGEEGKEEDGGGGSGAEQRRRMQLRVGDGIEVQKRGELVFVRY